MAYAQYCNVFPVHALWHIPEAASLWLNVFYLTTCLPCGATGVQKKKKQTLCRCETKFIVFNLLSSSLYAKCTRYTCIQANGAQCVSAAGSAKVLLSLAKHFICYARYFLSAFIGPNWRHSLQIADMCLGSFNYALLLSLIAQLLMMHRTSDCVCLLFFLASYVVVYLHAVNFNTAIILVLLGRQFMLQPENRQQFLQVFSLCELCDSDQLLVQIINFCWLNSLSSTLKYSPGFLKIF